jgi:hypothetical protein
MMRCKYCHKRLNIAKLLKGQSFCSDEHQGLFSTPEATVALERLRSSFADPASKKPLPQKQSPGRAEPDQAEQSSPTEGWAEPSPINAQAASPIQAMVGKVLEETASAETVEGVTITEEMTVEEATAEDWSAPLLTVAAEPMPVGRALPVGPAFDVTLAEPTFRPLDITPELSTSPTSAEPAPVDLASVARQGRWADVPKGYPPIIISDSAKLLLDSPATEPLPLAMSQPSTVLADPVLQLDAVMSSSLESRLSISLRADNEDSSEPGLGSAPASPAPACHLTSEAQQGIEPELARPTDWLQPAAHVERMPPAANRQRWLSLLSIRRFSPLVNTPFVPKQLLATPAGPILRTQRWQLQKNQEAQAARHELALASTLCAMNWTLRLDVELGGVEASSWRLFAADRPELPRTSRAQPFTSVGMKPARYPVPVSCQIAASLPQTQESAPWIAAAVPFLLLTQTLSLGEPDIQLSTASSQLSAEARRLPKSVSERRAALSAAHLQPSRPSPLSLVTWSRSLLISIPASRPSNLGRAAAIRASTNEGRVDALRPWPPNRRGYLPRPSLPRPMGNTWAPAAPMWASLTAPTIKPIRPGSEGTVPPRLVAVRVQPAAMPVQLLGSSLPEIQPRAGLKLSAAATVYFTSMDVTTVSSSGMDSSGCGGK